MVTSLQSPSNTSPAIIRKAALLATGVFARGAGSEQLANNANPALNREYFGFSGWRGHDAALWDRMREEARERGGLGAEPVAEPSVSGLTQEHLDDREDVRRLRRELDTPTP